jgi:hypothetical protein
MKILIFALIHFLILNAGASDRSCKTCLNFGQVTMTQKGVADLAAVILNSEMPGLLQDIKTERLDHNKKGFQLTPQNVHNCSPDSLKNGFNTDATKLNPHASHIINDAHAGIFKSIGCFPILVADEKGNRSWRGTKMNFKNFWIKDLDVKIQGPPRCENLVCELDVNVNNFSVTGNASVKTIEKVPFDAKTKKFTSEDKTLFEHLGIVAKYNESIKMKLKIKLNPDGSIANLMVPAKDSQMKLDSSKFSLGFDKSNLTLREKQNAQGIEQFGNALFQGGLIRDVLAKEIEEKRQTIIAKLSEQLKHIPEAVNQAFRIPSFFSSDSKDIRARNSLKDMVEEIEAQLNDDNLPETGNASTKAIEACLKLANPSVDICQSDRASLIDIKTRKLAEIKALEDRISKTWVDKKLNVAVQRVGELNGTGSQIVAQAIEEDPDCLNYPMFNSEINKSNPNVDVRAEITLASINHYFREVHKINKECQNGIPKGCDSAAAIEGYPVKLPIEMTYNPETRKYIVTAVITDSGADFTAKMEVKPKFCDGRQRSSRLCLDVSNYTAVPINPMGYVGSLVKNVPQIIQEKLAPILPLDNKSGITIPHLRPLKIQSDPINGNLIIDADIRP